MSQRWVVWALPALNLLALVGFFALDIRDLYYKVVWLGPYDSHSFHAVGTYTYETAPLAPTVNVSALARGDEVDLVSGFASFLSSCDTLYGTTSELVLSARGTNCRIGAPSNAVVAAELVLATSVRVDSIIWTSCKLLYLHRRPALCQENVVTEFFHRYRVSDPVIAPELMAEPNSDAEKEILALLSLISRSYPLSDVVCVEGFEPTRGPARYGATIFGCASPNVFDAVFVGRYATRFADLQAEMAWLTVDVLNLLGFDFVIRENSRSSFEWKGVTTVGSGATVEHHTDINFSSFGHFYILIIAIDLVLLAAHTRSALETANVLLLPLLGTTNKDDTARLTREYSWCILYRSLYRSPPVLILTVISGVLSWQLQLPNSIIWTWNEGSAGKANAMLSCMRVWMLVLCALHQLWGVVVAVAEPFAYRVAKRTYVSIVEVLVVSAVVAIANQKMLFDVSNAKYDPERQRLWDEVLVPRPHDVLERVQRGARLPAVHAQPRAAHPLRAAARDHLAVAARAARDHGAASRVLPCAWHQQRARAGCRRAETDGRLRAIAAGGAAAHAHSRAQHRAQRVRARVRLQRQALHPAVGLLRVWRDPRRRHHPHAPRVLQRHPPQGRRRQVLLAHGRDRRRVATRTDGGGSSDSSSNVTINVRVCVSVCAGGTVANGRCQDDDAGCSTADR
ncbi:hypothetical protein PINS_up020193 [Pythium insidiosum]|nr:hypothetical protein PINS_up020193 [Pythium insidiosum]